MDNSFISLNKTFFFLFQNILVWMLFYQVLQKHQDFERPNFKEGSIQRADKSSHWSFLNRN